MSIREFRYDIGVLRAFAVISVLFYHFQVPFFNGGFLGVDVFFVISGYLMTRIILNGFTRNNFSLKVFYNNRLKRIFPVLLVVSFTILVFSIVFFLHQDIAENAKNVILSSMFVSNIYYYLHSGYFDTASHDNIFLHSWSLSLEWQFYLLYPLLLITVKRIYINNKKLFLLIFGVFTFISLSLCLWLTTFNNGFAFYMFPTRAWEMTVGGIAFLIADQLKNRVNYHCGKIAAFSGYSLLLVSLIMIDSSVLWPSYYTLLPVSATFLIIAFNFNFQWLHNRTLQFFGNISYSLYLWHWPIYIVFQYFGLKSNLIVIFMIAISIFLSIISYNLIEKKSFFSSIKFVAVALPLILFFGFITYKYPQNEAYQVVSIYDDSVRNMENYVDFYRENIRLKQFNSSECFISSGDKYSNYNWNECLQINKKKKNVLLIGDSHAAQFSQSLHEQLSENVNLLEFNVGLAFPFKEPRGKKESKEVINKFYKEFLPSNVNDINLVVLSLHWPMKGDSRIGYTDHELLLSYKEFLNYFERNGIKVLVVGQQESFTMPFSKIVLLKNNPYYKLDEQFFDRYIDEKTKKYMEWLKLNTDPSKYIDIYSLKNIRRVNDENIPYMVDDNHFSKMGADQIVRKVLKPRIEMELR